MYARRLGDKPADGFLRFLCSVQFRYGYGYWPDFQNPTRFAEKLWSRQLHDRDARLTLISDKLRVREYVAGIIGERYLIPLHWQGTRAEEIPFEKLPEAFVMKANHGCAYNIIVQDKHQLNWEQAKRQLNTWLMENFGEHSGLGIAWAYKNIKPHILIEQMLVESGRVPLDYKFFCFSGRVEFFKMDFERFEDHATMFFDRELQPLNLVEVGLRTYEKKAAVPENVEEMIQLAESLAKDFDFIRVDLYTVNRQIYFSELTAYPGGISAKFSNDEYDRKFGEKWRIGRLRASGISHENTTAGII